MTEIAEVGLKAPKLLPVEQADREAAAKILTPHYEHDPLASTVHRIRDGKFDEHKWVQAFAKHRLAHTVPGDVGLREALEPFVNAGMKADPTWSDCATISNNRCGNDLTLGHLRAVMRIYAGLCARSDLSTSPVIDTNEEVK